LYNMNDLNKAQRHLRRRDDYYNNALKYAAKGKFPKASELLWGAVTQSLKALAATRDINITSHAAFFSFTRDLSKEIDKPRELTRLTRETAFNLFTSFTCAVHQPSPSRLLFPRRLRHPYQIYAAC